MGRTEPLIQQQILERYNANKPWLQNPFDEMNWLNGYGFGIRYRIDALAFDLKWENQIDRLRASGADPDNNNAAFEQELYFKLTSYGIGIESFFSDKFSIHASFDFNKIRYRTEITGVTDRFELMSDWGMGSTFSIGYNFVGNGVMHVSLRPYMHLSWTNHDLSPLDAALNPDLPSTENLEEEFLNFGLKIIFYNGQW